ncbi:hypothetical protein CVT25_013205 [Psilocybe cyanescens]|uniref:Uncharacterized protein n=1 Tax=Psilocybe cyanescens TaxID=93625 RepID=A0A409XLR6_PSICY|nr:hypothetical protein CVT25_013205 [Psilocybe cyanescens]
MPPDPPAHVPVPYPMYKCLGGYPTTKVFQSPTLPRKQPTVRRKLRKNPKAAITEKESMTVLDRIRIHFSRKSECGEDATPNMLLLNNCYTGKFIPSSFEGRRLARSKEIDVRSLSSLFAGTKGLV